MSHGSFNQIFMYKIAVCLLFEFRNKNKKIDALLQWAATHLILTKVCLAFGLTVGLNRLERSLLTEH